MGGGVVGTALAIPLVEFIGLLGTVIASIGVSLIMVVFIFGLHPEEVIANSIDKLADNRARKRKKEK